VRKEIRNSKEISDWSYFYPGRADTVPVLFQFDADNIFPAVYDKKPTLLNHKNTSSVDKKLRWNLQTECNTHDFGFLHGHSAAST